MGVTVILEVRHVNDWSPVGRGTTDARGRLTTLTSGPLAPGTLPVDVLTSATYHKAQGVKRTRFYRKRKSCSRVRDSSEHYHVPLVLSPFGYSTYPRPMTRLAWNRFGKARVARQGGESAAGARMIDLTSTCSSKARWSGLCRGRQLAVRGNRHDEEHRLAFARRFPVDHVEAFLIRLAGHFIEKQAVSAVRLSSRSSMSEAAACRASRVRAARAGAVDLRRVARLQRNDGRVGADGPDRAQNSWFCFFRIPATSTRPCPKPRIESSRRRSLPPWKLPHRASRVSASEAAIRARARGRLRGTRQSIGSAHAESDGGKRRLRRVPRRDDSRCRCRTVIICSWT